MSINAWRCICTKNVGGAGALGRSLDRSGPVCSMTTRTGSRVCWWWVPWLDQLMYNLYDTYSLAMMYPVLDVSLPSMYKPSNALPPLAPLRRWYISPTRSSRPQPTPMGMAMRLIEHPLSFWRIRQFHNGIHSRHIYPSAHLVRYDRKVGEQDLPSEGPSSILVNAFTDLSSFTLPMIS
jgi:hypothetical protein